MNADFSILYPFQNCVDSSKNPNCVYLPFLMRIPPKKNSFISFSNFPSCDPQSQIILPIQKSS